MNAAGFSSRLNLSLVRMATSACTNRAWSVSLPTMITDMLAQYHRYTSLSPRFAAAFKFLETLPTGQPDGRCDIDGDNCFALVQTYPSKPAAEAKFESHRQYIDIQFIQAGRESILWAPLAMLTQVTEPFTDGRDIAFYANPPHWTPINLTAGCFTIFFPEDGHAPGITCNGSGEVRKVVIKVRA
jgi:biofilm protein TabA